ncbi:MULTISPECIES: aminodeoxychorismate synthase component I [unclassified Variovorax]|uniref:aminodeoxychorismate synthase component I n=1 Tax=unclassified Variovorax TaxID=663243 RepID=UPI003ED0500F
MRTLLIDNYDSFTHNLYQYLAATNAQPPRVITNDEMSWPQIAELEFDNIVISPGPGRPQRPSDLGVSADVLRHARVPVLGVCLGHQAMAHFCGANVARAVRPMHGRLDRVRHSGSGLFRGIPEQFDAVRYHSLAVTGLPEQLEPLAWTFDGTLMALRHTSKPWWGVQFHPESICTEYGARLLRNFRELTEQWQARAVAVHGPSASPRWPQLGHGMPLQQDDTLIIRARCLESYPDAEALFRHRFAGNAAAFWLDSSDADGQNSRYSYMGDAGGPDAQVITYRSRDRQIDIHHEAHIETRIQSIFDFLKQETNVVPPGGASLPFDFAGGYVGYFGYELKGELGGNHAHDASTPDALWMRVRRFVAIDHGEQQTWIVCVDREPHSLASEAWMNEMQRTLSNPVPSDAAPPDGASRIADALAWRIDLPDYRRRIARCQENILDGETYEVCLTNQLEGAGQIDALDVYCTLRRRNPAPYAAFLKTPGLAVLCASPELFLNIEPDGTVESRPIKGTARRGATPQEDAAIAATLASDEKSRAENLMIVDLLRNDLNRVCKVGSVHVPRLFQIETFATVHQLVSTIRGQLRYDVSAIDCVHAAFPGGSMTGAPKIRTMRILDEIEGSPRGIYSGSIGFLSLNGSAKLNIVIRTIVSANGRVSIGSGGAIIAMSDPDAEVEEIVLKARAQQDVLQEAGAPGTRASRSAGDPTPHDSDG